MNVIGSECSSDSESGWTVYLEYSNFSVPTGYPFGNTNGKKEKIGKENHEEIENEEQEQVEEEEEEEEDLSMVSDASSGPPQFHEEEEEEEEQDDDDDDDSWNIHMDLAFSRKTKNFRHQREDEHFALDDTASSPLFFCKGKNVSGAEEQASSMGSLIDCSQGFSATHFQERTSMSNSHHYRRWL